MGYIMHLVTVKEVARLLKTSERNIHHKVKSGEIPVARIGRFVRIDLNRLSDIMGLVRSQSPTDLDGFDPVEMSHAGT